ncbi:unnamed protein product [Cuscuta epithymum]|uniref:Uncharacterized protein n=1 Tax=Cuscuta epithymum TaxID=186058 RepID=A0AAV0CP53_9ASTE|nr:unnamed protein product [Cuscuta epithymum]
MSSIKLQAAEYSATEHLGTALSQQDHHHHHHFSHQDHHHYHHHESPRRETHPPPKQTYRVYCKADPCFALAVRDGTVILTPHDPTDPRQHWVKHDSVSALVKDEEGLPSFLLVSKATGQAIQHAVGGRQAVRLAPYGGDGGVLDGSLLWTAGPINGDEEYKDIRMQNNIRLKMDAFKGIPEFGGVSDWTVVGLWEWNEGDNQRWAIVPY